MARREEFNRDQWKDQLAVFSKKNFGRNITLESEHSIIIINTPFVSITYDSIFGDSLKINMGLEKDEITRTIFNPFDIRVTNDNKGRNVSMQIIDTDNETIYIYFNDI